MLGEPGREASARFRSIPEQVHEQARERPDATALVCGEERATYRELDALACRVAAALRRDGLRQGDVAAICASSCVAYVAVLLGAVSIGVVVAPLPTTVTPESLAAMVENGPASVLFANASTLALVRNAGLADLCISLDPGEASLEDWLAGVSSPPPPVQVEAGWPFNIIYSSGTTGVPKGIEQSHARRASHAARSAALGYGPAAVTLLATPLYSNTTLVALLPTLAGGGTVVLMRKFDARGYLVLAGREKATHTMLVPVQYQRLLAVPDFDTFELGSFRMKLCAGAPFSRELKCELLRRWPGELIEIYGTTEGGGSCMLAARQWPDKLHTVGTPTAGSEFQVIGENGEVLPPGQPGEIVGRSAGMMDRYHGQARSDANEWRDAQGRRFLRSGDVGFFDQDGFLVLVDRKKDMIISGGFNVYPSDLELQLRRHPQVQDAAVVGVPSERWGETPFAYVVPRSPFAPDANELLLWCNARVGKTQRLAGVQVVADLPRNPLGKVLKRELKAMYESGASPSRLAT